MTGRPSSLRQPGTGCIRACRGVSKYRLGYGMPLRLPRRHSVGIGFVRPTTEAVFLMTVHSVSCTVCMAFSWVVGRHRLGRHRGRLSLYIYIYAVCLYTYIHGHIFIAAPISTDPLIVVSLSGTPQLLLAVYRWRVGLVGGR